MLRKNIEQIKNSLVPGMDSITNLEKMGQIHPSEEENSKLLRKKELLYLHLPLPRKANQKNLQDQGPTIQPDIFKQERYEIQIDPRSLIYKY